MKDTAPEKAIQKRMDNNKMLLIEQLKKVPIVEISCEKVDVGRATYYRWRHEDEEFARQADEALAEGRLFVNDAAESQLLSLIRQGNLGAVVFWLKNNHQNYTAKLEVTARLKTDTEVLTPEQEALVTKALRLASLLPESGDEKKEGNI